MKFGVYSLFSLTLAGLFVMPGCSKSSLTELKRFPIEKCEELKAPCTPQGLGGAMMVSMSTIKKQYGEVSLSIICLGDVQATTLPIVESGDIDIEGAKLVVKAKIFNEGSVSGLALYLHYPEYEEDKFDAVINLLDNSPQKKWFTGEISHEIPKGRNPDNIILGLRTGGFGSSVYIDDIRIYKEPHESK